MHGLLLPIWLVVLFTLSACGSEDAGSKSPGDAGTADAAGSGGGGGFGGGAGGASAGAGGVAGTSGGASGGGGTSATGGAGGSGGTGGPSIGGVVSLGATPVGGGKVEVWNAAHSQVLDTVAIDGSGVYQSVLVDNGVTYGLRLHPANAYSLDASETDFTDVVINGSTTKNFTVQAAFFADDFQSYANTAAMKHLVTGVNGSSRPHHGLVYWYGDDYVGSPKYVAGLDDHPNDFATVSLENGLGPAGSKVMRYQTWDNGKNDVGGTFGLLTGFDSTKSSTWYFRWMDYMDPNWITGTVTGGQEYKYCIGYFPASNGNKSFALEIQWGPSDIVYRGQWDGNTATYQTGAGLQGCVYPGGNPCQINSTNTAEYGAWNVWVTEWLGVGTSTQSMSVYKNGVKKFTLQGNGSFLTKALGWVQWGANMNSAPEQVQYRLFREIGVYQTRPAMIDTLQ